MSTSQYFVYRGIKYGPGTIALIKDRWSGVQQATYLRGDDWDGISKYARIGCIPDEYIIQIIKPIYYQELSVEEYKKANIFVRTGSGSAAHNDDIFHGLLLYIIVMIGAIIFNDRWLIWISATVIYFGWLKTI